MDPFRSPGAFLSAHLVPALIAATAATLIAGALFLLFRARRRAAAGTPLPRLAELIRGPRRLGYAVTILLVFGLGGWSAFAPLEGAAIAPGIISPDGNRRTVQHLEGGIIRSIDVREGDRVTAGQVLVTLDDVEARAQLDGVSQRYVHLLARAARLEAEIRGAPKLTPPVLPPYIDGGELAAALASQQELLDRRAATQKGQDEILQKRIVQLQEENAGLVEMNRGLDSKARLIGDEIATVSNLLDKGLERRPRLISLQSTAADIGIDRAGNLAQIARNEQKIGETGLQLLTSHQQVIEKDSEDLADVRRMIAEIDGQVSWRENILTRTEIRAPVSGTIMNLRVTTLSGVVRAGEPIMDIVPADVPLVIDAQVKPTDIDVIRKGMPVRVVLTAYQQRNMPQIFGTLDTISADRLVDQKSGRAYYLARVAVPREQIADLGNVEMVAGMPVEVMLLTGRATVADYVLGPLLASFRRSFHENQNG